MDLVSAVSSLSESKLNALGLCVSIATAIRAPGPWGFLVLDDPIQSWDADHETQFIEIVRDLAEKHEKQVILLSHRQDWIERVAAGCRCLNGHRYDILGYTQAGPNIVEVEWETLDKRLREIITIASDTNATAVRLQQAEQEVRIAIGQLAVTVLKKVLGETRSSHNLNGQTVREILNRCSCPPKLVDNIVASFETTDDAHHASPKYQPNAERLRQYHSYLIELKNLFQPGR